MEKPKENSYVVVLRDGRYSYAWGPTAKTALKSYLAEWKKGIHSIVPASEFHNPPNPSLYIKPVSIDPHSAFAGRLPDLYENGKLKQGV